MSKSSKPTATKPATGKDAETGKLETELLTKSGWPKTPKETIKMLLNFFANFS
ncbi:MAG: hypothetical protein V4717_20460 [Bacteroidota bacterium]